MNERIEQLAEEADEYAEQTVHYYQGQFDGLTWEGKIKQTRDTKFAELIVTECLDCIESTDSYDYESYDEWLRGHTAGLRKAKELIVNHFEVEE